MQILINNRPVEALEGETLIEVARRAGSSIPSLCYAKGAKHKSSCMACAVKDCKSGQIIPSCTTLPVEGMAIDTEDAEVKLARTLSLELLLSDHRADCEAPCSMVCSSGLDVERFLGYYDAGQHREALEVLSAVFSLPEVACDACKAPCEKVCRRGSVDKSVAIRAIIKELLAVDEKAYNGEKKNEYAKDKSLYQSRLGRFTSTEKEHLQAATSSPSRCLHCACAGREKCRLRLYSTEAGIKRSRYEASSALPMKKIPIGGSLCFEPAKCIRCGLCVYNSKNGFTFTGRGFKMEIVLPEENKANISENLAKLCPTGAIYKQK
ncbi:MAG: (2Fe-2S)-binding protein [Prevotellaceae bacterium]|jgi:predicted molibdopterin-dependent oxidoreductase YjgC|nr:(2Fe-2S)-binding protein [Prevotellaceae bacterium]